MDTSSWKQTASLIRPLTLKFFLLKALVPGPAFSRLGSARLPWPLPTWFAVDSNWMRNVNKSSESATGECLETAVSLNITWWVCLADVVVVWGMKGGWRCFVLFPSSKRGYASFNYHYRINPWKQLLVIKDPGYIGISI